MKKLSYCLLSLLILLPGCSLRKKPAPAPEKVKLPQDKKPARSKTGKNLFLDNVEGYEFEEESTHNAFAPDSIDGSSIKLVGIENQDDKAFAARRASQAQYGFKTIYFDYDRYTINPAQKVALDHNAAAIKKATAAGKTVVIEGHACKFGGSDAYNAILSEQRAQSVARYFVEKHGIVADKLKVVGRGHEMCIVDTGSREQQAPNRRVELYTL